MFEKEIFARELTLCDVNGRLIKFEKVFVKFTSDYIVVIQPFQKDAKLYFYNKAHVPSFEISGDREIAEEVFKGVN